MYRYVVLAMLICTASAWTQDSVKDEQKKLAGIWKLIEGQADGQALPEAAREKSRIVLEADQFAFKSGVESLPTTYTVDPVKGTITIQPPKGESKAMKGLYKLETGKLTLCLTDGEKLPTKLAAGPDVLYVVLERETK